MGRCDCLVRLVIHHLLRVTSGSAESGTGDMPQQSLAKELCQLLG